MRFICALNWLMMLSDEIIEMTLDGEFKNACAII
jgi:hypothetical protein